MKPLDTIDHVEAVQKVRQDTGIGLVDAKKFVDQMSGRLSHARPPPVRVGASRCAKNACS